MNNDVILISSDSDEEKPCTSTAGVMPKNDFDEQNNFVRTAISSNVKTNGNHISSEKECELVKIEEEKVTGSKEAFEEVSIDALLEKFISFCEPLIEEENNPKELISFIKARHARASNEFKSSTTYYDMLNRYIKKMEKNSKSMYVYINDFTTVLGQHAASHKKKRVLSDSNDVSAVLQKKMRLSAPVLHNESGTDSCHNEFESSVTNKEDERGESSRDDSEYDERTKRRIAHLESLMKKFSDEIKRLQAMEMGLDEMENEDSSYVQEGLLKKKIMKVFEKLCSIKNVPVKTGRVSERKINLTATKYPNINRKIESYVNRVKKFPDYQDICYLVRKENERNSIKLSSVQIKSLSESLFKEVGEKLQRTRHYDFIYNFGNYLTDNAVETGESDPAEKDPELQKKLTQNRIQGKVALQKVIEKFSKEQEDACLSLPTAPDDGVEQNEDNGSDPPSENMEEPANQSDESDYSEESSEVIEIEDDEDDEIDKTSENLPPRLDTT